MAIFPAVFVLNADAISNLIGLLLASVITATLLLGQERTRLSWWLAGYLAGFAALMGFMIAISGAALASWMPMQAVSVIWGAGCLIQFAYCFPRPVPAQTGEARLSLALSAGAFLAGVGMLPVWLYSWTDPVVPRLIPTGLAAAQFLWAVIVFARRSVALTFQHTRQAGAPRAGRAVWMALAQPAGKEAQATRAFVLAALSPMLIAVWVALYYGGVLPDLLYDVGLDLGLLAFPFLFFMIYLNYSPQPTSFMLKLVLSTLVTVLIVLSIASQVSLASFETAYAQARQADSLQVEEALWSTEPSGALDPARLPAPLAFVISRPAGEQQALYTQHFARDGRFDLGYVNAHGLGRLPTVPVSQAGPDSDRFYYHVAFERDGRQYVVGFPYAGYADVINPHALPLVAVIVGSVVLVLLAWPLFFRVSLVKPLEALLEGVRQVNAGKRDVAVPIQYNDEIGFLTGAFNAMVTSVKRAEELEALQKEMELARTIQASLLPASAPVVAGLDVAGLCIPAREVGGDLYSYLQAPPGTDGGWGVAVGDVTGKGMPAALYMAVSTAMLAAKAPFVPDVAQLMAEMSAALHPYVSANHMNTALCYVRFEQTPRGYTAHIANAGLVAPILRRGTQSEYLAVGGLPLGIAPALRPYEALTLPLQAGDMLVLSSDGIVEAMDAERRLYGFDCLVTRVASAPPGAQAALDWILAGVQAFSGGVEQHDDMTAVVICVTGRDS
ncbi:MAG: SpoIIE family protein phosphatase [Thermoflexales bacterium]|nr:SpoIIE family protein phosphatase [Thermoflexales bacterium]